MSAAAPRHTHTSRERQKPPVAYPGTLRKIASRVSQLTDELALECTTNVEFEEAARQSFEFLNGQVRTLKEAVSALADSFLEEVDRLSSSVRCDLCRLDERQEHLEKSLLRDTASWERCVQEVVMKQLEKQQERQSELSKEQERQRERQAELCGEQERQREASIRGLERQADALARAQREWRQESEARAEQLSRSAEQALRAQEEEQRQLQKRVDAVAQDLETIVSLIPNIEDTIHKTHSLLQDRIGESALDISRVNDAVSVERMKAAHLVERLEAKLGAVEVELREDLEQKHLKLQRSITRQLESMSRVLVESDWTLRPPGRSAALEPSRSSPAPAALAGRRPEPDASGLPPPPPLPQSGRLLDLDYPQSSRLLDLDLSSLAPPRPSPGPTPAPAAPPQRYTARGALGATSRFG